MAIISPKIRRESQRKPAREMVAQKHLYPRICVRQFEVSGGAVASVMGPLRRHMHRLYDINRNGEAGTWRLTRRGQAAQLPMLVHRITNPSGVRVTPDGIVERIHHDDLKVLVGGVLTDPVAVQDP